MRLIEGGIYYWYTINIRIWPLHLPRRLQQLLCHGIHLYWRVLLRAGYRWHLDAGGRVEQVQLGRRASQRAVQSEQSQVELIQSWCLKS